MDAVERIVALLSDDSPRKRIAAAVVLGELGAKAPPVISALSKMARDELSAIAEPAVEALGKLGARGALPVLLDALERKDLSHAASEAIAALGEDVLPALRDRMAKATPEMRAAVSGLLPALRGSFAMVLDGLRGQPWDAVSKVALSVRQTARGASPAERKAMARQATSLIKKLRDDEPALRGTIKILGYLELPETVRSIEPFLSSRQTAAVRIEAITALRFALGRKPASKPLHTLIKLLEDPDALVARAARDTLTVVPGVTPSELLRLAQAGGGELALWAIERLRALGASKELASLAGGADRGRAEAAVRALSELPGAGPVLVSAMASVKEEAGAHALAEALERVQISPKEVARLRTAGAAMLKKSFAIARRQLEAVRRADPQGWAQLLRDAARKSPHPEAVWELLARSNQGTPQDRYMHASLLLRGSSLDPHPRARQSDPALAELEKLAASGFALAASISKDRSLGDDARYHAAFHFAEHASPEVRAQGIALLEELSGRRGKLAKAARNKLSLLRA
ncbi:MAG: HEAT repeat domain-containing protein [Myxococcales bacterium]|nr:HEAT repeat domain-containing protein [Myxococcales bacterium]